MSSIKVKIIISKDYLGLTFLRQELKLLIDSGSRDPFCSLRISFLINEPFVVLLNRALWKFSTLIYLMSLSRVGGRSIMNWS